MIPLTMLTGSVHPVSASGHKRMGFVNTILCPTPSAMVRRAIACPNISVPLSPHDLANAELDKMLDDVAAAQDR